MKNCIYLTVILTVCLVACSKEPPKCSDPNSLEILKQIIVEHTQSNQNSPLNKFSEKQLKDNIAFEGIRANGYDKEIKKYTCEADLIIPAVVIPGDFDKVQLKYKELGPDWFQITFGSNFLESKQSKFSMNIQYESQLNDKNEHIVIFHNISVNDISQISLKFYQNLTTDYLILAPANSKEDAKEVLNVAPAAEEAIPYDDNVRLNNNSSPSSDNASPSSDNASPNTSKALDADEAEKPRHESIRTTPSFDCNKAKSASELLICNDQELAKMDRELADTYQLAKPKALNANEFKLKTIATWKWRESFCHDKECLVKWYAERNSALNKTIQDGTT